MDRELWLEKYITDPDLIEKAREDLSCRDHVYELAFELGPIPFVMLNSELEIIKLNGKSSELLGHVLSKKIENIVHHESLDSFLHYKKELMKNKDAHQVYLWFFINEEKKYINLSIRPLKDGLYLGIIIDESFTKETIEHLEVKGFRDYLTGLYNRRFFHEEVQRLDAKRNYPLGLIMADLNGLKLINDAFGHNVGDLMIKEVADVLSVICREDDILARIGGDEYAVVLPRTETIEMEKLLERIQEEVSKRKVADVQLSLAVGYSVKTSETEDFNHFFKRAEDLMYKDKLLNSSSQRADIINGILSTLHEKHPREGVHSQQVSQYMLQFGKTMGFGAARLTKVESAGLLHDIGKIAIDYQLLELHRELTEAEEAIVKTHSEIGYRILKNTVAFGDIAEIILYHHERIDGEGYPRGLRGSQIPLESRMLNICDAYDAMVSNMFYREPYSKEDALKELRACSGTQFDQLLLDIFITKVI